MNDNPIQQYVPIISWGVTGKAYVTTLQSSCAAAASFSPCSYLVHNLALEAKSDKAAKALQGFQYLANPIDAVIQAIAMPVFTVIDHIRDLGKGSLLDKSTKILLTPISLPVKLFCSLFVSAGYLFNGGLHLAIPYSMFYGVAKGKEAAQRYFYEINEINNKYSHVRFVKPIQILPLKHNDDQNPFCKLRNQYFLGIDARFKDFNDNDNIDRHESNDRKQLLDNCAYSTNFDDHIKKNLTDKESDLYKSLLGAKNKANENLNNYEAKKIDAGYRYLWIDRISKECPFLVNFSWSTLCALVQN